MSKISLLSLILTTALLGSCGFHTPNNNAALNASVSSSQNNAFATELQKRFNPLAIQSLAIEVGAEVQKKQSASFDNTGQITSYNLSVSVPVKVFKKEQLLLSENLTQTVHLQRVVETQADRLQITEHYNELRDALIKRLLRKLKRL